MSSFPEGLQDFVERAGWSDAGITALPGDASFRRYFRLERESESAMLMYAPPPVEDPKPFLDVAYWLNEHGMRAPEILEAEPDEGWVLTEDFGDERVREYLDKNPRAELHTYRTAVDTLVELHTKPAGDFGSYDMPTYQREAALFTEWYTPSMSLDVDAAGYAQSWEVAFADLIERQKPGVTVLRDYHAENIMLPPDGTQGLIDFQDALVGHPAYDLVSLLQDARRDVSPDVERAMLAHYIERAGADDQFEADYALLGAQRNVKIVGIFTRLYKRDGKPRYLDMIPRVWAAMERDLAHPALAPVAEWFDANIPTELRQKGGGTTA